MVNFKRFFILITILYCTVAVSQPTQVKPGAEVLLEKHLSLLIDQKVGVICNQASVLSNGTHLVDALFDSGVNIVALFSPEHGIRGDLQEGQKFDSRIDEKTGLMVYSLYGKNLKPTSEMLEGLDVLLFDLQDVGARFYTFSITMSFSMQAAAENAKKFIVLDRPNPINGIVVEGTLLNTSLKSGVGILPIPIRHGLTLGEMAKMVVGEKWLDNISDLNLQVIPMEGWRRETYFDETNLSWIPPSPNMKSVSTSIVYPGSCLIEGTNISEGRGTNKPFEFIGAPWIDAKRLSKKLNSLKLPGIDFQPITFIPKSDTILKSNPKHEGLSCGGVFLKIYDRKKYQSVITGMKIIQAILEMYPDSVKINTGFFDKLVGSSKFRKALQGGKTHKYFQNSYKEGLKDYNQKRQKYIIY
jgi:beta-N-acetylhexosaminidase